MGWGTSRLITIVENAYQEGSEGIEPAINVIGQRYAQVRTVNQSRNFEANLTNAKKTYEILLRYDSTLSFTLKTMIEFDNRRLNFQTLERVAMVSGKNKYSSTDRYSKAVRPDTEGRYWRIIAISQDIS